MPRRLIPLRDKVALLYFYDVDPRFAELHTAGWTVLWGLLVLPPTTAFGATSSYRYLLLLAPEWIWGLLVLAIGARQLIVSTHPERLGARLNIAYIVAVTWFVLATFSFLNNPFGLGIILHLPHFVTAVWTAARLNWEQRYGPGNTLP